MMNFLAALDYHYNEDSSSDTNAREVEYLLNSWGEIYPPFLGDRVHSTAARFIMNEYPFKLFSSNTPYDGPVPYMLTVTFLSPSLSGGEFPDEIAQGFAGFLSVVTRRRVFPSHLTRYNGMPIMGEPKKASISSHHEQQPVKEIEVQVIYDLLRNLHAMDRDLARSCILAIGLYHAAVELMLVYPEFAYLSLITALETISSRAFPDFKHPQEDNLLDSKYRGWSKFCVSQDKKDSLRQILLQNEYFTFAKLDKFVNEHLPEKFWSEEVDDAKPMRLWSILGPGPEGQPTERIEKDTGKIEDYERFERDKLTKVLRCVYGARSCLVHEGKPFPESIVVGLHRGIPAGALSEMLKTAKSGSQEIKVPPLLTFERLVSYCLVEFMSRASGGDI